MELYENLDDVPADVLYEYCKGSFLRYVATMSHDQRAREEVGQAAFRIASLVESDSERFGYVLALGPVNVGEDDVINSEAYMIQVDREKHETVGDAFHMSAAVNVASKTVEIEENYLPDHDTSARMLTLLHRAHMQYFGAETRPLDRDVRLTLSESNLDYLAAMFPEKASTLQPAPEIVEPIERHVAQKVERNGYDFGEAQYRYVSGQERWYAQCQAFDDKKEIVITMFDDASDMAPVLCIKENDEWRGLDRTTGEDLDTLQLTSALQTAAVILEQGRPIPEEAFQLVLGDLHVD